MESNDLMTNPLYRGKNMSGKWVYGYFVKRGNECLIYDENGEEHNIQPDTVGFFFTDGINISGKCKSIYSGDIVAVGIRPYNLLLTFYIVGIVKCVDKKHLFGCRQGIHFYLDCPNTGENLGWFRCTNWSTQKSLYIDVDDYLDNVSCIVLGNIYDKPLNYDTIKTTTQKLAWLQHNVKAKGKVSKMLYEGIVTGTYTPDEYALMTKCDKLANECITEQKECEKTSKESVRFLDKQLSICRAYTNKFEEKLQEMRREQITKS